MTISVIIGSTRQGRFSEKPAQWILQELRKREESKRGCSTSATSRCPSLTSPCRRLCLAVRLTSTTLLSAGRRNSGIGRFYFRHAGIQLRHLRSAQKCDRLGLSGVEPQGGCLRKLRQRHGRARQSSSSGRP